MPEKTPKTTQKAIASVSDPARDHRIRVRSEQTNCEAMCMLSAPVLSENVARVKRPIVEAPFMMVRSQKVWSGLSLTPLVGCGTDTILETLRVPKPRTAAHYTLLVIVPTSSARRYIPLRD